MEVLKLFLLGIIQGLTELLPISSSGHTAIIGHLLRQPAPLMDTVVFLHLGTFLSLLFYFWGELRSFATALLAFLKRQHGRQNIFHSSLLRKYLFIGISFACTSVVAFPLKNIAEKIFASPSLIATMLIVNGGILWIAQILPLEYKTIDRMGWKDACIIGIAQGMAVIPGISRLGLTVAGGLFCGFTLLDASLYSLALSIPTIFFAGAFETFVVLRETSYPGEFIVTLLIGVIAAAVVGYLSIKILVYTSKKANLSIFACYSLVIGSIVLLILTKLKAL